MQDWVGLESFSEGQRLRWDWQLDDGYYPHWKEMTDYWATKGIKPFIYINPYFANTTNYSGVKKEENQFDEAYEKGYFIKDQEGKPMLMYSSSIQFGCVDLTNPDARLWIKKIIQENMIEKAGAWGWMHDFGEYVTLDSKTFDG